MNTDIKKTTYSEGFKLEYIPIRNIYNILSPDHYSMCYNDLNKDPDLYADNSDWFGGFIYDSTGMSHLVSLICINDNNHNELKKEYNKPLHISVIEVDEKYRDSLFPSDKKLHIFSRTLNTLDNAAKEAGYDVISLMSYDTDRTPKYLHMGYKIADMSKFDDDFDNDLEKFYSEHPFMIKEL